MKAREVIRDPQVLTELLCGDPVARMAASRKIRDLETVGAAYRIARAELRKEVAGLNGRIAVAAGFAKSAITPQNGY